MTLELILIALLFIAVAFLAASVRALSRLTKEMAEMQLCCVKQDAQWVKFSSEIHTALHKRLAAVEQQLNCEVVAMPIAETRAWDALSDEALRNFEKECGE